VEAVKGEELFGPDYVEFIDGLELQELCVPSFLEREVQVVTAILFAILLINDEILVDLAVLDE